MADDNEQTPAPQVTPDAQAPATEAKTLEPAASPDQVPAAGDVTPLTAPKTKAEIEEVADALAYRDAGQPASEQQKPATSTSPSVAVVSPATNEQLPAPAQKAHQAEFKWKQEGNEVAPLTEMRAYLHSLKESGVAVGSMQIARQPNGKLEAGFGIDYDPTSKDIGLLDGLLRGVKKVGNGLSITEPEGQQQARQQVVSQGGQQELADKTGQQAQQTFGRKNWDGLSAALMEVPSKLLSPAEKQQQQAGAERIEQLAEQQGKDKKEVIKEGKSLLDIEQASNPFSSFLKNFHSQLTGGAVQRTTNESNYEATRQQLREKLEKRLGPTSSSLTPAAGSDTQAAQAGSHVIKSKDWGPEKRPEGSPDTPDEVAAKQAAAQNGQAAGKPATATVKPTSGQAFQPGDLREDLLQGLAMSREQLAKSGQLEKLLNGERTELLPLQVTGPDSKVVNFEARMQLQRNGQGKAELQLSLPKEKLEIPQEISGAKLTEQQQQRLAKTGQAGLIKGLTDPKTGEKFDGFVGVDPKLNRLVALPAKAVKQPAEIAGVKLDKDQQRDLEQGKVVKLQNMKDGQERSFNGTAQINAATARVEVRQAAKAPALTQQPAPKQQNQKAPEQKLEAPKQETPKQEAPKVKRSGPKR